MFRLLGKTVSRGWPFILLAWLLLGILMGYCSPDLSEVTTDGPGFLLPDGYPSREAQELLNEGFGEERSRLIVLISGEEPLTEEDRKTIRDVLKYVVDDKKHPIVGYVISIWTVPQLESRLTSKDARTLMCAVVLKSQFVDLKTYRYIAKVEAHLDENLTAKHPHLSYKLTDSAVIGRDYDRAAETSLDRTRFVTAILVLTILLLLYRSPVTWIVPLSTIALSLFIATCTMALLAQWFNIPKLIAVYLVVIIFGSGTDYCLFLIGRFREELVRGHTRFDAVRIAVTHVGEAITASAGTTIAGLSMMAFADFEIFRTTGPSLGIGLAVGLIAALTFAPSLMVVLGKRLFWPRHLHVVDMTQTRSGRLWGRLAGLVVKRPGLVLVIVVLGFTPLSGMGGVITPSYDLFTELPDKSPSVQGNQLVLEQFDRRSRAEQVILVVKSDVNFNENAGLRVVDKISRVLGVLTDDVIEVRSATQPLGKPIKAVQNYIAGRGGLLSPLARAVLNRAKPRYVSKNGDITRINILLVHDTFSPEAMQTVERLRGPVTAALEQADIPNVEFGFAGISAHMRDLAEITRVDLRRLRWMVLGVLFVILAVVLRGIIAPIYLLATMVVNYFAALGITHFVFINIAGLFGPVATGLDWKVEFFLFVLLVAIGVDYNIYIMSRLREELKRRPFRQALHRAVVSTGSIISSCGVIMAGTFGSMMASPLTVMMQIGCAMAVGVLMDTFVVRPLVVPSLAMLVERLKEKIRGRKDPPAPSPETTTG